MSAHEDKFREALIEFLQAEDCLSADSFVTHFYVVATSESMKDSDTSLLSTCPSTGFPFVYQMGALEYALTKLKARVAAHVQDTDD